MGGFSRCGTLLCCSAYLAVKLPLATFDKKSVDCQSRGDCSAGDSCVSGDGGGPGCGLFRCRPGGTACVACRRGVPAGAGAGAGQLSARRFDPGNSAAGGGGCCASGLWVSIRECGV